MNTLCHKMTLHRINIFYTIFVDGKGYEPYVSMTKFTQMRKKPGLEDQKEP